MGRQGRDANRRLQRAIRAGKARERLPALVVGLGARAGAWAEAEGRPFLWDGEDFQVRGPLIGLGFASFSNMTGRQSWTRTESVPELLPP
jgi:hypothetical protein